MRKLVVTTLMSLDGVVSAPEQLLPHWNDENKNYAVTELAEFDAFLFGRKTFEMFAARWPSVRGDPFADALNSLPKYVASRTLTRVTWTPSHVWSDDVTGEVARLKKQSGKHIMKYGLGQLDRTLIEHRLVDELRVSIVPIVIGAGRRLFEGLDLAHPPQLRLEHERVFGNGIIRASYGFAY